MENLQSQEAERGLVDMVVDLGDGSFHLQPDPRGFFTSYEKDGRFVSYYGDNHPRYAGNVVKAMASARQGYPVLSRIMAKQPASEPSPQALMEKLMVAKSRAAQARSR